MPFENFYKEADQHAHRWRICLITAIGFIAAYCGLPVFVSWLLTPSPSATTPVVTKKQWREADELCQNLPKPERFSLINTERKKNANGAAKVVYTYSSERGLDEIMPQFLIWFEREGWEQFFDETYRREQNVNRVFNFRNGHRRISVLYFDWQANGFAAGRTHYEIVCTVEKLYRE